MLITADGYTNNYYYYKFNIDASNEYAKTSGLYNLGGTYVAGAYLNRKFNSRGSLYYTLDGSTPTTHSSELTPMLGYGVPIDKTTTVKFLYVNRANRKFYFEQTYIVMSTAGNTTELGFNGVFNLNAS